MAQAAAAPGHFGQNGRWMARGGPPSLTTSARHAKILETLHYVEGKHVWHVRIFRVLQRFRVKAAGAGVAASANLAYGAVRAAAESLSLTAWCAR